jgi:hypothetical protein
MSYNFGFERWLDFSVLNFLPVNPPEKGMTSNIFFTSGTTAQAFSWILRQKL